MKVISIAFFALATILTIFFIYVEESQEGHEHTNAPEITFSDGQSTAQFGAGGKHFSIGADPTTPPLRFTSPNTGMAMLNEKTIVFVLNGESVGEFWFDDETQLFRFEGDAKTSLEIFTRAVLESETMTEIEHINHLADSIR